MSYGNKYEDLVSNLSLWYHLLALLICNAVVWASLSVKNTKDSQKPWKGLDYNDPGVGLKIFTYVVSVYVGSTDCGVSANSEIALIAQNIVMFFRFLFVLHVAKDIYIAIKSQFTNNDYVSSKDAQRIIDNRAHNISRDVLDALEKGGYMKKGLEPSAKLWNTELSPPTLSKWKSASAAGGRLYK